MGHLLPGHAVPVTILHCISGTHDSKQINMHAWVAAAVLTRQVWNVNAAGERYQRWWGEQHLGDRRVRRHGHSTSGA